ncbi:MAG: preprotein translocase subunit SecA [Puniceicoccales bacterium]|jgi:preprotein translocase subunit SecA|nr:preprotein translocase subunit SecA [Puniceicoccales bacterium]
MSFLSFLKIFAGSHHRRFVRQCAPVVKKINALELKFQGLSDEQLQARTPELMARYSKEVAAGKEPNKVLDELLPEAFAIVKNTARRFSDPAHPAHRHIVCEHELEWNMVHYDVQLIGGIALHQRYIAEMATGEGKTLVATLPLYLNALTGRNCHIVTVNDYLARRDAEWMGHLFKFLGLTVGCIQNYMGPDERHVAYGANITYGTASEFGFDYLRDNGMASSAEEQVQREHFYCIVDEIDSILIDEARTPLIISGPVSEEREAPFARFKPAIQDLVSRQERLCNRLISEAHKELEKPEDQRDEELALQKMLQVQIGMPRNKQLLRMMENGAWRKMLDKFDAEMHSDFNKDKRYRLKEKLYYAINEKQHEADLTQVGRDTLRPDNPDAFVLPDLPALFVEIDKNETLSPEERAARKKAAEENFVTVSEEIHTISTLVRAYALFERDVHYVVQDGKVVIVDENTGRIMPGRRWSEGLHQAVEAKENVKIEKETKTYATITIQNYFRLYEKLAGMTGTAETEAGEFNDIYRLGVVAIPTNKPCIRIDENDIVFKTRNEKYRHAIDEIKDAHERGQPVLVGTASVNASETLSRLLRRAGIEHQVLNAKNHQIEADIIANAGQRGAVTIATNMAGRGTDIRLGEGVKELGGLYVLATERHESRRVDRQLRGRCSRQGDPGRSKFLVSLEDDLMRLFANAGPISRLLENSFKEGEPLEHPLLNRSIGTAQKRVEGQNYTIRKRLLEYDDVLNHQREIIYTVRNQALRNASPRKLLFGFVSDEIAVRLDPVFPDEHARPTDADLEPFLDWLHGTFPLRVELDEIRGLDLETVRAKVTARIEDLYTKREEFETTENLTAMERYIITRAIDRNWQDHLTEIEDLRRSVGLRGYGQKNPLNEYKNEAFTYFENMMNRVRGDICNGLFRSATSEAAFNNLMSLIYGQAQMTGPADASVSAAELLAAEQREAAQYAAAEQRAAAELEAAAAGAEYGADDDNDATGNGGRAGDARSPAFTIRREYPKIGRNALVRLRHRDGTTQDLKWKKAEPLLRSDLAWDLDEILKNA